MGVFDFPQQRGRAVVSSEAAARADVCLVNRILPITLSLALLADLPAAEPAVVHSRPVKKTVQPSPASGPKDAPEDMPLPELPEPPGVLPNPGLGPFVPAPPARDALPAGPVRPGAAGEGQVVPSAVAIPRAVDHGRTESASRQFVIVHLDKDLRGRLSMRAEEVRSELVALLDRMAPEVAGSSPQKEAKPLAITIFVRPGLDRSSIAQLPDGSWHLPLVIPNEDAAQQPDFRRRLLRLLLAERILRAHPQLDRAEIPLPAWLETGVLEALEFGRTGQPAALFQKLIANDRLMSAESIVYGDPATMNAMDREVFRASSGGLLLMLLDQPQGGERLRQYLSSLATSHEPAFAQVLQAWPGLKVSKHAVEKWWTIKCAELAQPSALDFMTRQETERLLTDILTIRYEEPDTSAPAAAPEKQTAGLSEAAWKPETPGGRGGLGGFFKKHTLRSAGAPASSPAPGAAAPAGKTRTVSIDISEVDKILALPAREKFLARCADGLVALSYRAFPLHRSLIQEYQAVVAGLRQGKKKGLPERLSALAADRKQLSARLTEIEDYLNWYEATQQTTPSGLFDDLLAPPSPATPAIPKFSDPITRYMDEMEKLYK